MDTDDTVEVFLMKAPIWEFKFGDLLGHFVSKVFTEQILQNLCSKLYMLYKHFFLFKVYK